MPATIEGEAGARDERRDSRGGEEAEGDEGALRGRVLSGGGTVQASGGCW